MKLESAAKVKYGFWGLVGGAVIAMILGFVWGGWTTSSTANATTAKAVVSSQSAICVAQFVKQPNHANPPSGITTGPGAAEPRSHQAARPAVGHAPAPAHRPSGISVADQALHRYRGAVRLRAARGVSARRDSVRRAGGGAEPSRRGLHVRDAAQAGAPARSASDPAG